MYYVYFVSDESERVKVGLTNDLDRRLWALQTGNAEELRLLAVIPLSSKKQAEILEKHLHGRFDPLAIRGEWFRVSDKLRLIIAALGVVFPPDIRQELRDVFDLVSLGSFEEPELPAMTTADRRRAAWVNGG